MDVAFLYVLLPKYGIVGYFISFAITHVVNFFLSIRRLLRITKESIPMHIPILTLAAATFSVWAALFIQKVALRITAFIVMLLSLLVLLRILGLEDLVWLKGMIRKNDPSKNDGSFPFYSAFNTSSRNSQVRRVDSISSFSRLV